MFLLAQGLCILFGLIYPDDFRYVSATNVSLVLKAIPVIGMIALGVGVLMISGEFDLSVGSAYTLTAYALTLLYLGGAPLWLAVGLTLLLGAAIGVINGLITVRLAIPSFITTLGSMMVLRGLVRWISTADRRPSTRRQLRQAGHRIGARRQRGVRLVPRPRPCRWDRPAPHQAGQPHVSRGRQREDGDRRRRQCPHGEGRRLRLLLVGATLAGIVSTTRVSTVTASQGIGFELKAITVCVIGGLFLSGGRGTVIGIFVGACLMYTVEDVLLLLRAPGFYIEVFIGVILVGAVIVNTWLEDR